MYRIANISQDLAICMEKGMVSNLAVAVAMIGLDEKSLTAFEQEFDGIDQATPIVTTVAIDRETAIFFGGLRIGVVRRLSKVANLAERLVVLLVFVIFLA